MWIVKLNPPGTDSSLPVTASVAINEIQSEGKRIKFEDAKITFNNSGSVTVDKIELKAEIVDTNVKGEGLVLQVGPNAGQIMHIPIDSVKPVDLGLIDGIPDVTTSTAASSSLAYVDEAMQKVSTGRSRLGSKYNALEHIISNLNNSSENLTAAESRIRDADIAEEMMNLTKNNILSEAAQAIMSQANQVPQRVLDLIQK
jgi:flagellin